MLFRSPVQRLAAIRAGRRSGLNDLGGDGDDKITIGTGSDTVDGGAGKDTIIAGANLGATDVIDGGDGTDTLQVTAVNAAALAGVTNVENLQITGGATVSLAADLPFTTIDLTDGSSAETLTWPKATQQRLRLRWRMAIQ